MNLLDSANDTHSENGEDGIIRHVFSVIGQAEKVCCEFGAWDGIKFSNTRALVLDGWRGIFIEADPERYRSLVRTYAGNPRIHAICTKVDDERDSLDSILEREHLGKEIDFLSIDVDGLDYYIFKGLTVRPRLICVEVNAGHSPCATGTIPRDTAVRNIGQPLPLFCEAANRLGYRLLAYTGNAFFLRDDLGFERELPTLSPIEAYQRHLSRPPRCGLRWLYLVNRGFVQPFHRFGNPYLSRQALGLPLAVALRAPLELARHRFAWTKGTLKRALIRSKRALALSMP